jgi:iron(III) transport system substrate-binding protein
MTDRPYRAPMSHLFRMLAVTAALTVVANACAGDNNTGRTPGARTPGDHATAGRAPDTTLTVYSRREAGDPLFQLFERQTGIKIRTRWGDPVEMADQIIAGGANSPADVFDAPLSDALGSLSAAGRLARLSDSQLDRVPEAYRSPEGTWVGTSGRAHVVFYNTDLLDEDDLPDSILDFTDPAWRGRIAWDPTSRSLQDTITELRLLHGENAARRWLNGIQANTPAAIQGTPPIINAVAAGRLAAVGFGSHSYLNNLQADGDATNVAAKFYTRGAPGGLLNVAGVGILKGTDNKAAADTFVDFMLSHTAQQYLAEEDFEIPVVKDAQPPKGTPTANELTVPGLDVQAFEQLRDARQLLAETGITM